MSNLPNSLSVSFVEGLLEDYLRDPTSVPPDWRAYFEDACGYKGRAPDQVTGPTFRPRSIFNPGAMRGGNGAGGSHDEQVAGRQHQVDQLIRNYRIRGHTIAAIDPLSRPRPFPIELDPAEYGFTEADLDRPFSTDAIAGPATQTLREILARLGNTYCRSIGAQFMHIDELSVRRWLQERMEGTENYLGLTRAEQLRILRRLTDAVIFEQFVQKKFLGEKSFSLEGAETLIPLLEIAIEKADEQGLRGVVLGMAHRGRLNVLANIMGKSPQRIFREFDDTDPTLKRGRGDVKYHLGYSTDWQAASGRKIHLSLCFNPSHLEFVNPVALGRMRANQDRVGDAERKLGMVLLIHGDAAFAGEGIVQETLNLSQLGAYTTGGTLHVIVNNQIGFTTSPQKARSGIYATSVAKLLQVPIFHVNGEDPDAVAQVVRLSMDFRLKFRRDVVIDMYCYRRRGHNETDEPSFTQPLMYQAIEKRKDVREGYLEHLLRLGGVTQAEADRIADERRAALEHELSLARTTEEPKRGPQVLRRAWSGLTGGAEQHVVEVDTGLPKAELASLLDRQTRVPEGFTPHPRLLKNVLEKRRDMAAGATKLDWPAAEAAALASLAVSGTRIRMTGQDCERGTFSQRHSVLHDYKTGSTYMPLANLDPRQAPVEIADSPLSETAVLGFEYGYSLDYPEALVIWEAQFGDFWNVAQPIVDQFIASAESKWNRLSGLVMLLPHGFEGMGPEHSSARLERFLQLAAEDNIQVVYPSTPAQYFHVLRRQVLRKWRKPLVVMTPKGMLRTELSTLEECAAGRFQLVIPDASTTAPAKVRRILVCAGKIYYDLEKRRSETNRDDVAIIRIEQLYPLPGDELREALTAYADNTPAFFVQEEPENQGAWRFLLVNFGERLFGRFPLVGVSRPAAASPATGSKSSHKLEQEHLIAAAFGESISADPRPAARGPVKQKA